MRILPQILLFACTLFFSSLTHAALDIQPVALTEEKAAWLVEDYTHPVVRIQFTWRAGSAFDPTRREGTAGLLAAILDEGGGEYSAQEFRQELAKLGALFSVSIDKLYLQVQLTALQENLAPSLALLSEALLAPHIDKTTLNRVGAQQLAALQRRQEQPGRVVDDMFYAALYPRHPYGHPPVGTARWLKQAQPRDIKTYYSRNINHKNLTISAVGAVSAAELQAVIMPLMTALPAGDIRNRVFTPPPEIFPSKVWQERDINQVHIILGQLGITRQDEDYFTAFVLNHILGGGGFTSQLMQEVREERGLAYSVYSAFEPLPRRGTWFAKVQTKPSTADKAVALIKTEMQKLRDEPVTPERLQAAKDFLLGSFPLRIDNSNKILGYLTVMQQEELGINYLHTWPDKVEAVTAEDIQASAQRRLQPEQLLDVRVGPARGAVE